MLGLPKGSVHKGCFPAIWSKSGCGFLTLSDVQRMGLVCFGFEVMFRCCFSYVDLNTTENTVVCDVYLHPEGVREETRRLQRQFCNDPAGTCH